MLGHQWLDRPCRHGPVVHEQLPHPWTLDKLPLYHQWWRRLRLQLQRWGWWLPTWVNKYQFLILFNTFVFFLVSDDATLDVEISGRFHETLAEEGRVQHHLRCWAINGWTDRAGMDQWCMNNCLTPEPWTNCPSTTSDGGGCDCNCDAGDDGCPREWKNINSLFYLTDLFFS